MSDPTEKKRLAAFLARKIFEAPTKDPTIVRRIAFKGVHDRNRGECDYGGLCEEALVHVIAAALEDKSCPIC